MCPLTGPKPGRHRGVAHVATIVALVSVFIVLPQATASADTRSSSRVVGRGDILTTILARKNPRRTMSRGAAAPRCHEVKFTDNDIEMLIGAISWDTESEPAQRYAALVSQFILTDPDEMPASDEFDLIALYCDGAIDDIRAVPRQTTTLAQQVARSMITRLPEPVVHVTPPDGSPVPVGEPVFISIDPQRWRTIEATLELDGVTASVRATPTHLRTFTGEPGTTFTTCDGRGRRYDPAIRSSARAQAFVPGACTISYKSPFEPGPGVTPRLGSISVLWRTEWRTDDGEWHSLGLIPRTRVFVRSVVELATPITRSVFPTPSRTR